MNSGKEFERRFGRSLRRLPGMSERVEDMNGHAARGTVRLGDFKLYRPDGHVFAIECKSTAGNRVRLLGEGMRGAGFTHGQLMALSGFDSLSPNFHGLCAILFGDVMALVPVDRLVAHRDRGKKSISRDEAVWMGRVQEPEGEGWKLEI